MRLAGLLAAAGVVIFWLTMNGLLLRRTLEYRSLDRYRQGVVDFLGGKVRRERALGIFRRLTPTPERPGGVLQRIGYTRFALERLAGAGEAAYSIDFSTRAAVDLFGSGTFSLDGRADLDSRMVPEKLFATICLGATRFRIDGRREGEALVVKILSDEKALFQARLPRTELLFSDGLAPSAPVGGLKVGDTYSVPVLDPVFHGLMGKEVAETKVVETAIRQVDGFPVECLVLETTFRGACSRSWVTADGEVLRQELPPPLDLILIREDAVPTKDGNR